MEQTQQNKRLFKLLLDFEKEIFQVIGEITAKELLTIISQFNLHEWQMSTVTINPAVTTRENQTVKNPFKDILEIPFDFPSGIKPERFIKPSQHPFLAMKSKFIDDDTFDKLSKEEQERIISAEKEHEKQVNNNDKKESETDDFFILTIMFSNAQKINNELHSNNSIAL